MATANHEPAKTKQRSNSSKVITLIVNILGVFGTVTFGFLLVITSLSLFLTSFESAFMAGMGLLSPIIGWAVRAVLDVVWFFGILASLYACIWKKDFNLWDAGAKKPRVLDQKAVAQVSNLNQKGLQLINQGKFKEASESFRQVMRLDLRDPVAWKNYGICLQSLNQPKKARMYLEKASELYPNDLQVLNNFAICLTDLARFDEAISIYEKLQALAPKKTLDWSSEETGIESLGANSSTQIDVGYARALAAKGDTLLKQQQFAEALRFYDKALSIDSQCDLAKNGRALVQTKNIKG